MRIKGLFWILTALLLSVLAIITYHAFYTCSIAVSSSRFISLGTVWSC